MAGKYNCSWRFSVSFWSSLLRSLGVGKKKNPDPPTPPAQHAWYVLRVSAFDGNPNLDEKIVGAHVDVKGPDGYSDSGNTDAAGNIWFTHLAPGDYTVEVSRDGFVRNRTSASLTSGDVTLNVELEREKAKARKGVVHGVGHEWVDDDGAFLPLGVTLMWALHGWKFDRERVKKNVVYARSKGADYLRILCEVGWQNNDITPDVWTDWDTVFAEFIDYCYDEVGIRVQPTVIAGGTSTNYDRLVDRVIAVLSSRKEKIQFIEVANEWFLNFNDEGRMRAFGRKLKNALSPLVVALSTPDGNDEAAATNKTWVQAGDASGGVKHFDRSHAENDCKPIRKPWEAKGPQFPSSHNEPQGPRSSVAEYTEPVHIVMSRAVGILCGWNSYIIHNGAGVGGLRDDARNRPANLWEVDGVDAVYDATRALDAILPNGASNGVQTRFGLGNHPLSADAIWTDGADHGVVRDYACVFGDGSFWQTLIGIKDHVDLKPSAHYALSVYNPVTGKVVMELEGQAGFAVRVMANTVAQASNGLGFAIVRGKKV
jgi:hypothetical protein